jgi:hypothetical protein
MDKGRYSLVNREKAFKQGSFNIGYRFKEVKPPIVTEDWGKKKVPIKKFLYNNKWYTTPELCEMLGVNRKVFASMKRKYNDNIQYMMDVKLGKTGFD